MRYLRTFVVLWTLLIAAHVYAAAPTVFLYADTAPNVYGSPNWSPWWTQAKADAIAGTFVNMRSGAHPGTTYFEPEEEIVYSTMDLGRRLHWIYWVPGTTIAELQGCEFAINWVVDWAGVNYVYDWSVGDLVLADLAGGIPTNGWIQPTSWTEESGGVVGTFGFAWWAYDDLAPPFDTNPPIWWDETDADDVAALAAEIRRYQTHVTGYVRWKCDPQGDWNYRILQLNVVPEPGTLVLWLGGIAAPSVALLRRRK